MAPGKSPQPIQTGADDASVQGILRAARVSAGKPDRTGSARSTKGIWPGYIRTSRSIFSSRMARSTICKLGKKDFTGVSVYALVDNAKDVALLPESLLVSADKPLQDLRDHAVLHITSTEVNSFELKNSSGDLAATKEKDAWKFTKPGDARGDDDGITSLLSSVSTAKMAAIVSETADNLGKYGLTNPAITFTASDEKGKTATLEVGKKEDDDYYARDPGRSMVFRINQDLYKKLTENYNDLRDKKIAHLDQPSITHVEIHNANGSIVCTRKSEFEWTFDEPADQKGKSASPEKLFTRWH